MLLNSRQIRSTPRICCGIQKAYKSDASRICIPPMRSGLSMIHMCSCEARTACVMSTCAPCAPCAACQACAACAAGAACVSCKACAHAKHETACSMSTKGSMTPCAYATHKTACVMSTKCPMCSMSSMQSMCLCAACAA